MTLAAGTQIGKYVVRQKLAEGGMAEIYLCAARGPEGFEKEVVIKRVRQYLASDPGFVEMFIAEARVASRLNHANVVQIFDFDKHEDTYYLAMELVRGGSLWDLRKRCKEQLTPVPPVLVAHIGAEAARGLHYAHRVRGVDGEPLNLVHRDVTPHNILLSFDGAVKLTDFGIAKAGSSRTEPGMLKGKFAYMSPEQARGEPVDPRTDIFALGVVLWEMLTGGRLFEGDSELAVLRAVQQSVIPPPARLNPDVPPELDAVVCKALERDPGARYQSAFELERALGEVVLRHAKSVSDTDVGAFMRQLWGLGFTTVVRTVQGQEEPAPSRGGEGSGSTPREPTAVMPGSVPRAPGGSGVAQGLSPDEDVDAPTYLLQQRRAAPPTEPMPSVGSSPRTPSRVTPSVPLPTTEGTPEPAWVRSSSDSVGALPVSSLTPSGTHPHVLAGQPSSVATGQGGVPAPRRTGWMVGLAVVGLAAAMGGVALMRPGARPAVTETPVAAQPSPAVAASPRDTRPEPASPPPAEGPAAEKVAEKAVADTGSQEDAGTAVAAPDAEPVPPVATAETPSAEPASRKESPRPAAKVKAKGQLVVRAIPFATVLLDGKTLGEVQGRATFSLAAGRYKLTFVHPDGSKTYPITIEPNGTVQRQFRAAALD